MHARNKAQFGLAVKIYSVKIFLLNNSAICLVNTKAQNKQMHGRISPRRACNPCGYTMKISCRYHKLLIYHVKTITEKDGLPPFKFGWSTIGTVRIRFLKKDSFVTYSEHNQNFMERADL